MQMRETSRAVDKKLLVNNNQIGSSNNSDAGTMARIIGAILEFLCDDHGVFVVMTSNDISQLPPELTRAGRLDAIWYFALPTESERKEIFKIHFNKRNKKLSEEILSKAAKETENFTGAEIQEVVRNSIRKAYFKDVTLNRPSGILIEDIEEAISETITIYKSSLESVLYLEEFAKTRARHSSGIKNTKDNNIDTQNNTDAYTKPNVRKKYDNFISIDDLKKNK